MSHQDAILEAIRFSADCLLKEPLHGSIWTNEVLAVLGHLGHATGAVRVCVFQDQPCPHHDEKFCISLKSEWARPLAQPWTGSPAAHTIPFSRLYPEAFCDLLDGRPACLAAGRPPLLFGRQTGKTRHSPVVNIPILVDNRLWGLLSLEQDRKDQAWPEIEIDALRTIADILGSAIHHQMMVEFYQAPVERSIVGIFLLQDQRIMFLNPRFARIFGYVRDDLTNRPFLEQLVAPEDRDLVRGHLLQKKDDPDKPGYFTFHGIKKDGTRIILELSCMRGAFREQPAIIGTVMDITKRTQAEAALVTGYVGTVVDIDNRKEYEKTLKASLDEKSILIMEIHHRVKNNLQIISGMIRLQARQITNKQALDALHECETRVITMALVHESLYQSDNLANINARRHITNLANTLVMSDDHEAHIDLDLDVEDMTLDVNMAIPASLIINELVINALKHAFVGRTHGRIRISLHHESGTILSLMVSDDGAGLPPGMNIAETKSLGLKLVTRLVRDQLKGDVTIRSDKGTSFLMRFPEVTAATTAVQKSAGPGEHNAG
ncbi:MAG: histidine kinase dimerization/phosphoacceptor domain -containing protein [Methanoregula sp.]|uniref:histidine kinase dimerization/phosphoacceptor domain -containing protein n=1 Tax=Methanoregula sp. TaxID=2052170 RepID=UPI003BAF92B6